MRTSSDIRLLLLLPLLRTCPCGCGWSATIPEHGFHFMCHHFTKKKMLQLPLTCSINVDIIPCYYYSSWNHVACLSCAIIRPNFHLKFMTNNLLLQVRSTNQPMLASWRGKLRWWLQQTLDLLHWQNFDDPGFSLTTLFVLNERCGWYTFMLALAILCWPYLLSECTCCRHWWEVGHNGLCCSYLCLLLVDGGREHLRPPAGIYIHIQIHRYII